MARCGHGAEQAAFVQTLQQLPFPHHLLPTVKALENAVMLQGVFPARVFANLVSL